MKRVIFLFFMILLIASRCQKTPVQTTINSNHTASSSPSTNTVSPAPMPISELKMPIVNGLTRITKKPFGIYITPQTSPVSPEKFKGYHTGTDFEIFDSEKNADVEILATCDGKLLLKKSATGYGGVIVQSCILDGQNITVLYGHLKLSSISTQVGEQIKAGDKLGVLGKGYSTETDGERKHLHFAIHKGTGVALLGYTQNKADLVNWLDVEKYLK